MKYVRPKEDEIVPLRVVERRAIDDALHATGGRVRRAAKLLGVSHSTIYRRVRQGDRGRKAEEKGGSGSATT